MDLGWCKATLELLLHQAGDPDTRITIVGAVMMIRFSPAGRESGKGKKGSEKREDHCSVETCCGGD